MSKIRTFKNVGELDHTFTFVCRSRNTRHGFAHDAELFCEDFPCNGIETSCFYLNRTWERYEYQSVMFKAVRMYQDIIYDDIKSTWMIDHGYSRMNEKRRQELSDFIKTDKSASFYRTLLALYQEVADCSFYY